MTWRWLGLAFVFLPASLSAQWYEWRDDRGVVHVTNQPAPRQPPQGETSASAPAAEAAGAQAVGGVSLSAHPNPADAAAEQLRRHEARLADREAYLRLLRAAGVDSAARREQENLVVDEARRERAAIDALRAGAGADGEGRREGGD